MSAIEKPANSHFLRLLSAAIWGHPLEASDFEGIDKSIWNEIASMAQRQSVRALVADKVLLLPADCLPPSDITLRFISVIEQTKNANRVMINLLKELQEEYNTGGVPFSLTKRVGQRRELPRAVAEKPGRYRFAPV